MFLSNEPNHSLAETSTGVSSYCSPTQHSYAQVIDVDIGINTSNIPSKITTAALLNAAWAVLLFWSTNSKMFNYSHLFSGPNAAVNGIGNTIGL